MALTNHETPFDISEFSQIGNVDVGVNVDVECHPVGFSTPQNCQLESKE